MREPAVKEVTGLSGPTIYRKEKAGSFPQRVKISAQSVGWFEDEIAGWMEERAAAREAV